VASVVALTLFVEDLAGTGFVSSVVGFVSSVAGLIFSPSVSVPSSFSLGGASWSAYLLWSSVSAKVVSRVGASVSGALTFLSVDAVLVVVLVLILVVSNSRKVI